ncbi:MAG: type II toxin-antitoxin system VapC family toxin [Alphaproteobacteria bacterium]|nr:type II toxin-antitoxin system VapC family toxin [Alphaproteobacteria bacterium]MBV9016141.1 type II toxin-antitoxin system VapC family toxin [Alphaproteobacteria bacterium]
MRLLIDTHVLLWADERPQALVAPLRAALIDPENDIFVSAASVWEIAVKRAIGKLRFDRPIVAAVTSAGFGILSITGGHAEHAGGLPRHHNDPFDRLLIAQAALEGMVLGTQDRLMRPYGVAMLGLS